MTLVRWLPVIFAASFSTGCSVQIMGSLGGGNSSSNPVVTPPPGPPAILAFSSPAAGTPAKTGLTVAGNCQTGALVVFSGSGWASPANTTCTSGTFSQAINFTAVDGTKTITV